MIPLKLKLSNFTSYGQNPPELDFTRFKLAAISGLNGAGKSSLLDAITWCVWGVSRAGDSSDLLIHSGANDMHVAFSFELDGQTFTVKRRRQLKGGGSTSLELWSNSHNLTEGTIKATQEKIHELLHLSFETFTNSSYLRQGHADEFTTKGPTDRKRILADILGLDHYDKLEEMAKEKGKDAQTQLTMLEYQLLEIEAELSQKEVNTEKKKQAEEIINQIEVKISILEKELKILQEGKATLSALSDQQYKLKQTLADLQKELNNILTQGKARAEKIKLLETQLLGLPEFDQKLKELKDLEKEKEQYALMYQKKLELENQLSRLNSELALKKQQKETLEKTLVETRSHLNSIEDDSAKCPTCGQIINAAQKQKVKKDYLEQERSLKEEINQIKTAEEEMAGSKIQSEITKLLIDNEKFENIIKKIDDLSNLEQKKELLIALKATLESEKKVVVELRYLFSNKKSQIEKLEKEVEKLPNLEEKLAEATSQLSNKEAQLAFVRAEEKGARNLLGQATQLISRVEQLEKLASQQQAKKLQLQNAKEIYEELALAFGKKGIQAMIIEAAIPEIEDEANKLLGRLTEGRMKIRLETQKETKTKVQTHEGKVHVTIETLDIIISDEMGERLYENFSGGEQFRVNFAIRLAISKLLTHRAGAKLQFLVIDEGFGSQDAPGRARLIESIDAIKNDFEKILIITHIEELKEEFPVRIEVSKNSSGSAFEVIGV